MNNFLRVTIVFFRTHRATRNKKCETACLDYGMRRVGMDLFIGILKKNEKEQLLNMLRIILTDKKSEMCHAVTLCKKCENNDILKLLEEPIRTSQKYEIVD